MKRVQSTQAVCAKAVRKELKAMGFKPDSVRSDGFSMGDAVRVRFTDIGPEDRVKINEALSKYQYGSFNGMEDIYEYNNVQDVPQVKYVTINFQNSVEMKQKALTKLIETFVGMETAPDKVDDPRYNNWTHPRLGDYLPQMVHRFLCDDEKYATIA